MASSKYKKITDLFVVGTEVVLGADDDGKAVVAWLQALNPFELDQVRSRAHGVRGRVVLALEEHGSDELSRYEAAVRERGDAGIVEQILDMRDSELTVNAVAEVNSDPEWQERLNIVEEAEQEGAAPLTAEEKQVVTDINRDYLAEIQKIHELEQERLRGRLEAADREDLVDEFKELWITQRGNERAMAEYVIAEIAFAARECDAVKDEDGKWDHAACGGHAKRIWDTIEEVRDLPAQVQQRMAVAMRSLNLSQQEAKTFRPEA